MKQNSDVRRSVAYLLVKQTMMLPGAQTAGAWISSYRNLVKTDKKINKSNADAMQCRLGLGTIRFNQRLKLKTQQGVLGNIFESFGT